MNPPRIKIISDGHATGTKVYVKDEDGVVTYVPNVVRVYWSVKPGEPAKATIDLINVEVDILGEDAKND